jgi:RNAse (barnase) inhibitor barstar
MMPKMQKRQYEIDGQHFSTLEGFAEEFSKVVLPTYQWYGNLDAFNDILYGGFGTPDEGFILIWKNAALSSARLGYPETVRQLQQRLTKCHPTNRELVANQIAQALQYKGPTVFDWLVEIIHEHHDIELRLE